MSVTDRSRLLGRRALLAAGLAAGAARALGRVPSSGKLRIKLPWPVGGLDPHALEDATAALFGAAIADPLFALDAAGRPYPALASAMPEKTERGARIVLRPLLTTARGAALDARDVLFSLSRSRKSGGVALLSSVAGPEHDPSDPLAILVRDAEPIELATKLASPVTAIVPRGFSRMKPDGTGAFVATPAGDTLSLARNPRAARGASFLISIEVVHALDLADSLRAFEAGETDVGWLGAGYHRPRPGAQSYDAGSFGWAVLRTGREAGRWAAPGVAQQLLDAIAPARLSHLGLYGLPAPSGSFVWGGAPADILVADDSPHLVEITRSLAALLSQPGHELRPVPRPRREIEQRRTTSQYALLVDFVRTIAPSGPATELTLLTAVDPALARRPPRQLSSDARRVGRSLPLGIIGELRIAGSHIPSVHGLNDWNLGSVWRAV